MSAARSATLVLRVDAGGMDAGYRAAAARTRAYAEEVEQINSDLGRVTRAAKGFGDKTVPAELAARKAALEERKATMREAAERHGALQARLAARKAEAQAAWETGQKKVAADLDVYRSRAALEDRYYALTHGQREVDLHRLQTYYARLRAQHAGNAAMLVQIDRTYAAETAALGGPTSGRGILGMLGGRRLVGQQLRYGAATALGMHGGGVGMAASAALVGGPAAAITAGVLLIGEAYGQAKAQAEALLKTQKEHRDVVRESVRWAEALTRGPETASGRAWRERTEAARKRAEDLSTQSMELSQGVGASDILGMAADMVGHGRGPNETAYAKRLAATRLGAAEAYKEWITSEKYLQQDADLADRRATASRQTTVERARLAAMYEGPEKRRLQLTFEQEAAERQLREAHADRMQDFTRMAEQGTPKSQGARTEVERYKAQAHSLAAQRAEENRGLARREAEESRTRVEAAEDARRRATLRGADLERADMEARQAREREADARAGMSSADRRTTADRQSAERVLQARGEADRLNQERRAANEARIGVDLEGFARDKALLAERHQGELEAAKGSDTREIRRRQAAEQAGLAKDEARQMEQISRQWRQAEQTALAGSDAAAQRENRIESFRLLGLTVDQVTAKMRDYDRMARAVADAPLLRSIEQAALQLRIVRGEIGPTEAAAARLRLTSPGATAENIRKAAGMEQRLWAENEKRSLHPMAEYRKYRQAVDEARTRGDMNREEANTLLARKAAELGGGSGAGRFTDVAGQWREIQSAALKDSNVPRQTLEEICQLRDEFRQRWSEGVALRAG